MNIECVCSYVMQNLQNLLQALYRHQSQSLSDSDGNILFGNIIFFSENLILNRIFYLGRPSIGPNNMITNQNSSNDNQMNKLMLFMGLLLIFIFLSIMNRNKKIINIDEKPRVIDRNRNQHL